MTLKSLRTAAKRLDAGEFIVVHDDDSRGLSWARNRGLERAKGEYVFFVDADDTVDARFLEVLLDLAESTQADFALSSLAVSPLKRDYNLKGGDIRRVMLPAFVGYSFNDVKRYYKGGKLDDHREFGSVCRCIFKRDFIEKNNIRFDEDLRLYEDAPFMAECSICASKVSSTSEVLYRYAPSDVGLMRSSLKSAKYFKYKFEALNNRLNIASRRGEVGVLEQFRASAVFSLIELFKAGKNWKEYLQNKFVKDSLFAFPISIKRPVLAVAVISLRLGARLFA